MIVFPANVAACVGVSCDGLAGLLDTPDLTSSDGLVGSYSSNSTTNNKRVTAHDQQSIPRRAETIGQNFSLLYTKTVSHYMM